MCGLSVEPLYQPEPSVLPLSTTSLNVTWSSAEPSTQLRGVARNYSVYMWVVNGSVSSWQVRSDTNVAMRMRRDESFISGQLMKFISRP